MRFPYILDEMNVSLRSVVSELSPFLLNFLKLFFYFNCRGFYICFCLFCCCKSFSPSDVVFSSCNICQMTFWQTSLVTDFINLFYHIGKISLQAGVVAPCVQSRLLIDFPIFSYRAVRSCRAKNQPHNYNTRICITTPSESKRSCIVWLL